MSTRGEFLKAAGAGTALLALGTGARKNPSTESADVGAQAAPGAPNVLFILTDDQPPHSVRRMQKTLARFADGLDLTDTGYCAVPICGPDRASLLTGLYPHNHGCLTNVKPTTYNDYRSSNHSHERDDLLVRMRRVGYDVGFFGKFLNGFGDQEDGSNGRFVHPGATRWHALASGQNN